MLAFWCRFFNSFFVFCVLKIDVATWPFFPGFCHSINCVYRFKAVPSTAASGLTSTVNISVETK